MCAIVFTLRWVLAILYFRVKDITLAAIAAQPASPPSLLSPSSFRSLSWEYIIITKLPSRGIIQRYAEPTRQTRQGFANIAPSLMPARFGVETECGCGDITSSMLSTPRWVIMHIRSRCVRFAFLSAGCVITFRNSAPRPRSCLGSRWRRLGLSSAAPAAPFLFGL